MDVSAERDAPMARFNDDRFEAALEKVAAAAMTAIEPDAVTDVEPLNGPAEVRLSQFQEQVIVILHQDKGVQTDCETLHQFCEQFPKMRTIARVTKNRTAFDAAGGYVIPCPRM